MAASSSDALEASDPYAKHLAHWRDVELPAWQQRFDGWDLTSDLVRPPKPPTVSKKGLASTPARTEAYWAERAVWQPWYDRWEESND